MAGYFLHTVDAAKFEQLVSSPTQEHCNAMAAHLAMHIEDAVECGMASADDLARWRTGKDELATMIGDRLKAKDWYDGLSRVESERWDELIWGLLQEDLVPLGIEMPDYESIYWDCADMAAESGAALMEEPAFGNGGFRGGSSNHLMYTIYPVEKVRELLTQLESVTPRFEELDDDDEVREQFFEGLLPVVRYAAEAGRVLWIQTDT